MKKNLVLILIFNLLFLNLALADSSGPNSPGASVNDSSFGSVAWTNADFSLSSDNSNASISISPAAGSQYLKATNFGFSIPANSEIQGIIVEIEKKELAASDNITDARVRIIKGGSIGTTDKASGIEWGTTDAYTTYGNATDLWGEIWNASDINSPNFGAVIAAGTSAPTGSVFVDHIRITVHYTSSGGSGGEGGSSNIPSPSEKTSVTRISTTNTDGYDVVKTIKTGDINLYIPESSVLKDVTSHLKNDLFIKIDSSYISLINADTTKLNWANDLYIKDSEGYTKITALHLKNAKGEYSLYDKNILIENTKLLIFADLTVDGNQLAPNGLTYSANKNKDINPFEVFNSNNLPYEFLGERGLPKTTKRNDQYLNTVNTVGQVYDQYCFQNSERCDKWLKLKEKEVIPQIINDVVADVPTVNNSSIDDAKNSLSEKLNPLTEVIARFSIRLSEGILGNFKKVIKRSTIFASFNSEKGGNEVFQSVVVGRISPKALSSKNKKYSDVRYYTDGLNTILTFKNTDDKVTGIHLSPDQVAKILSNPMKSSKETATSLSLDMLNAKKEFPLQDRDLLDRVNAVDRADSADSIVNYRLISKTGRFNAGKVSPPNPQIDILSSLSFDNSGNPVVKSKPCNSKINLSNLKKISC